jgi:hypothetical protein
MDFPGNVVNYVSGHLKPSSKGHFLKPKTSHPEYYIHKLHYILFAGFNEKDDSSWGIISGWTNSNKYKHLHS